MDNNEANLDKQKIKALSDALLTAIPYLEGNVKRDAMSAIVFSELRRFVSK